MESENIEKPLKIKTQTTFNETGNVLVYLQEPNQRVPKGLYIATRAIAQLIRVRGPPPHALDTLNNRRP